MIVKRVKRPNTLTAGGARLRDERLIATPKIIIGRGVTDPDRMGELWVPKEPFNAVAIRR